MNSICQQPNVNVTEFKKIMHTIGYPGEELWRMKFALGFIHIHWNGNVILIKFSPLVSQKVFVLTTSIPASDEILQKCRYLQLQNNLQ